MMRKTSMWLIVGLFMFMSSVCFAGSSVDVDVDAQVLDILELNSWIKYFIGDDTTPVGDATSFDFETLTDTFPNGDPAGVWYSPKWYTIYLLPATSGDQYQIKQTCTGLTAAGGDDLNNSFVVTPNYAPEDWFVPNTPQGPMPAGATLGDANLAVASDHVIYTSDPNGEMRIIQAIYSIPNESDVSGFEEITYNCSGGSYSGDVTFTVVEF